MIRVLEDRCDFCGTCVSVCPHDALLLSESHLSVIKDRCTECLLCVHVCPLRVLEVGDDE
ncbi:MAG: 4Fe-4S binding protein [candidate division KSB1 bacterium]|jgi:NAD-dependent dihydropyrimidine dehydrogenase PreA subunit|nr:4Fe-4S binding protein [candidate division KSB1 bacterium]